MLKLSLYYRIKISFISMLYKIIQNHIYLNSNLKDNMDEEYNNEYLLELEKLMNSEVAISKWAPTMDILALATFDNFIEGYRISFKAQRFFQIEQSQSVTSMCFSPDSHILAYALTDGSVKLIKTENGQKLIVLEQLGCEDIQNMNYLAFDNLNPESFMPLTKSSIENKLILSISPHKNCNKNAIIKINYFQQLKDNFSCLVLSDMKKTYLLLNGFMQIAEIDYRQILGDKESYRILFSHLDENILYSIIAKEVQSSYHLSLAKFPLEGLLSTHHSKSDIITWSCLLSNVTEILTFVQSTYTALETQTREIIRQYNSKINLIDDGVANDVVPCKQLLRYLTIGLTSSTLVNFFTKQVYDSKILQKLDETLTTLFAQLHDIILESVQNGLQRVTLIIEKLLNWTDQSRKLARTHKNSSENQKFNIVAEELIRAREMVRRLYTLGEMILVQSTQAKFSIRNLLVWLNKTTIKTSQENETQIQNSKSYLNKYTVDYNRLHKFLSNEGTFKLQNLLQFFRKTQDLKAMIIPPADFSLLSSKNGYNPKKQAQQTNKRQNYDKLSKLLDIDDIKIKQPVDNINQKYQFYSFKVEMKKLLSLWRSVESKPNKSLSHSIKQQKTIEKIGKVNLSEQFEFIIHPITKNGVLYIYYIEYPEDTANGHYAIVQYNCASTQKSFVYTNKYKIHSISVSSQQIIAVLQDKNSHIKTIGQIANETFNNGQIQIGKAISNCDQGVLDIQCSQRGLNCLIVDKTKLVIFQ